MSIYKYNDWSRKQLVLAAARAEVLLARSDFNNSVASEEPVDMVDDYLDELADAERQVTLLAAEPREAFDYVRPWVES